MKISKTGKILIASGATLIVSALLFGKKARANQLKSYVVPAPNNSVQSKVITNHDGIYDYKYENEIWYTRKKGATSWINMQTSLSPENYQIAISRLNKYL